MNAKPDDRTIQAIGPNASAVDAGQVTVSLSASTAEIPGTPAEASSTARNWIGKKLGKYEIVAQLGEGGMGVVFKARDPMIERDVAIKLLADHLANDPTALERFVSEAKAAGKLSHPNVAAIFEICQEGAQNFLVMEYISGGSLSDWQEGVVIPSVLETTNALIDACRGMSAAHSAGLIHRDLKPANLMRAADGTIKVMDFGLAKITSSTAHQLTQAGTAVGTPFFMSPEQCESRPADGRSDVYALGATYYCLLTGTFPYENSESITQVMYQHCHGPVPDPRSIKPQLPEACTRIVARAMAKAPADRYQSAGEMLSDLQMVAAALSGQSIVLPSESSTVPALGVTRQMSTAGTPKPRRKMPVFYPVLGLLAVVALALALWRPWQKAPQASPQANQVVPPSGEPIASPQANQVVPPAGEPIRVGVLHSMSGTMASSETVVVEATLFAIEEINSAGGVLGRPIKAVLIDGRSDNAVFAREAARLIAQEQVCTVFGCWTSASRKTVKPIFEEHDHLLMYPVQYEGLETSPNIVYMGAAPNQQIIPAVQWAVKDQKRKRFFLVGSDYVFPRAANEVIKDQLKRLGAEVVGEAYVPIGSQKVESAVEAIKQAKPDMILNTINGDSNIAFFRVLRAAGIKSVETPTLSFSVGEQELRNLDAADLANDYAAWTYFQAVDTPENVDFVKRFRERYPQRSVTDPMEAAYIGVKLWAQAVNEAQSLEPKKIRRALLNQRFIGPGGAARIDPDTQHCYKTPRIGQIQSDGQIKIVWAATEPVQPEPFPDTRTAAAWHAFLHDLYTGWGNRWTAP